LTKKFIIITIDFNFSIISDKLKMSSPSTSPEKKSKDNSLQMSSKNAIPYKNDSDEPGIVVVSDQGSNQERPFREELSIGGVYQKM
jgi:hypothetical protein